MPTPPPLPEPFASLQGVRFWPRAYELDGPFVFGVGWYHWEGPAVWEPAIWIDHDDGTRVDKVTVNLPEHQHALGEIFVPVHGYNREGFNSMLEATQIFERKGQPRASGYVAIYAETWGFRRALDGTPLIQLERVRAMLEQQVTDELERRQALQAAHRLGAKNVVLPKVKRGAYVGDDEVSARPRWSDMVGDDDER